MTWLQDMGERNLSGFLSAASLKTLILLVSDLEKRSKAQNLNLMIKHYR